MAHLQPAHDPDHVIVGVDQSSKKLAVTILTPVDSGYDIEYMGAYSASKKAGPVDRLLQLSAFLDNLLRNRNIELLLCESPLIGRGGAKSTILQAQVVGALYLTAKHRRVSSVDAVHPSTWKSQIVGNGKASKDDVAAWVRRERAEAHRLANGDQDMLDSYCIAEYAADVYTRGVVLTGGTGS